MHDEIKRPMADEQNKTFVEGVDFYFEEGLMVLTRKYLLEQGFCCDGGCRHCPYGPGLEPNG